MPLSFNALNSNSAHRHRLGFRNDLASVGGQAQTASIYNINGHRVTAAAAGTRFNASAGASGISIRSPIRSSLINEENTTDYYYSPSNESNQINDNDQTDDEDGNDDNDDNDDDDDDNNSNYLDEQTDDSSFNSADLGPINELNNFQRDQFFDEDENSSFTQSSMTQDCSDDDDDIDDDDDDSLDTDDDVTLEEEEDPARGDNFEYNKRRRLNSSGGFQQSRGIKYIQPTKVIKCKQSKRIRALAFNPKRNEIAAISMNAAFHYFDVNRFEQKYTKKLSPLKENVCLTINNDYSLYAIGSASHVQLLDANTARPSTHPIFIKKDIGVRSLHFRNMILSIGTGIGTVLFYDIRAQKFLNKNNVSDNHYKLQTTGGWILRNETYYDTLPYAFNTDNSHAIYSHSYDPTGTKLLTVGGPLTVNLYGHYAGIWK
jgi:hypothetical protein